MPSLCREIFKFVADAKPLEDNPELAAVALNYLPAGTSSKNMEHWYQLMTSDGFKLYDFGDEGNLEHYGSFEARDIDLTILKTVPIGLFSGLDDELADVTDTQWLRE